MTMLEIPSGGSFRLIKALAGFKADLENRLRSFPYDHNVFIMMKYRPGNQELSEFMCEVLREKGFRGIRADHPDWNITENVYNPLAVLYCCKYGIALFDEPEAGQSYSANVAYELGIMHYQGKRCLILRHNSLPTPPFDLIKDLHTPYQRDLEIRPVIRRWVEELSVSVSEPAHHEAPHVVPSAPPHSGSDQLRTEAFVTDPSRISVTGANVTILQRRQPYWRLSWKVGIQNLTPGEMNYRIQVMYLDANGHSLDDQDFATPNGVAATQLREFSHYYLIDHELGQRLAAAAIHVTFA